MYFTKEGQTLYLSGWDYNGCLIIEELAKLVIAKGGRVQPNQYNKGYIENPKIEGNNRHYLNYNGTYIRFVLDGYLYYFQIDDNPFFPFYYSKYQINPNNTYCKDVYSEELDKDWLFDCYWRNDCTNEERQQAAETILNILINAPKGKVHRDTVKQRVPNIYDNGYHYETITKPTRMGKINF